VGPLGKAAVGSRRRAARARPAAAPGDRGARARRLLSRLRRVYPGADCELEHRDAFELLIATILSAQSTDATVNRVTRDLFARFPDARALAAADLAELELRVHPTGFFRQKARAIRACAARLLERHGGRVPDAMGELVALPGVARKTANVVLGTWFGKNEGIVVDTHVGRLAHRLDLVPSSKGPKDAVRIEQDLMQLVPRRSWTFLGHALILHGRRVCTAARPRCEACVLARDCPSAFATAPGPGPAASRARTRGGKG
jgi:endonuclease-3